jgi:hypothetical protein
MPDEVVVDANVLGHSANVNSDYFDSALKIVLALLESDDSIALDDTGKQAPALRTSHMYREYEECLPPGALARELLRVLANGGRINFYLRPARDIWKACQKLIPRNAVDAIVLGVGVACPAHLVVSNDYQDFPHDVRREAHRKLGVLVRDSDQHVA